MHRAGLSQQTSATGVRLAGFAEPLFVAICAAPVQPYNGLLCRYCASSRGPAMCLSPCRDARHRSASSHLTFYQCCRDPIALASLTGSFQPLFSSSVGRLLDHLLDVRRQQLPMSPLLVRLPSSAHQMRSAVLRTARMDRQSSSAASSRPGSASSAKQVGELCSIECVGDSCAEGCAPDIQSCQP